MKVKKAILFGLVLISFLLPYVTLAYAQNVPKYVGIREGATYTWKTEFDDGPLADYYEATGFYTAELAELEAEKDFDRWGFSTSTEGWKMYIVDLYPEREQKIGNDEYDRVKYVYNWYKTKHIDDPEAWRKIEKYDTATLYEPDEDLYRTAVDNEWGIDQLFIPKRLHFEDIADEIQEDYEDYKLDDKYDADVSAVRIQYFMQRKVVGISTEWNYKINSKTESFESLTKYTDDGILYYYEYTYDGDIIQKMELQTIGGTYLIENWWWIAILAGAALVVVIVVVVVIIVKKKR